MNTRFAEIAEDNRRFDREVDAAEARRAVRLALSGYPFYPCPICHGGVDGCDHKASERASVMHPGVDPKTFL